MHSNLFQNSNHNCEKQTIKRQFCLFGLENEITEIKLLDKKANYFADIDLSNELEQLVTNFKAKIANIRNSNKVYLC